MISVDYVNKINIEKGVKYRKKILDNVKLNARGCWEWSRYRLPLGYGRTRKNGSNILAHRMAWEEWHGTIPLGMMVCHKCDNPPCCNPEHLFLGTAKDNSEDMREKGRDRHTGHHRQRVRKLTHEQVDFIRASPLSSIEVAILVGCSSTYVYMIRSGKRKTAPR